MTGVIAVIEAIEESAGARVRPITAPAHEVVVRAASTKQTPTLPVAITVPVSAKIATPADGKSAIGTEEIAETAVIVAIADDVISMIDPDETCLKTDLDVAAAVIETAVVGTVVIVEVIEENNQDGALHLRGRRSQPPT